MSAAPDAYAQGWNDASNRIGAQLLAALSSIPGPNLPHLLKCRECGQQLEIGVPATIVGQDAFGYTVYVHKDDCPVPPDHCTGCTADHDPAQCGYNPANGGGWEGGQLVLVHTVDQEDQDPPALPKRVPGVALSAASDQPFGRLDLQFLDNGPEIGARHYLVTNRVCGACQGPIHLTEVWEHTGTHLIAKKATCQRCGADVEL